MRRPRGRPETFKQDVTTRLPTILLSELKTKRPELLKPHNPAEWRHGALSRYIEKLIWKDLRGLHQYATEAIPRDTNSNPGDSTSGPTYKDDISGSGG